MSFEALWTADLVRYVPVRRESLAALSRLHAGYEQVLAGRIAQG
jgi:hypothetical protein